MDNQFGPYRYRYQENQPTQPIQLEIRIIVEQEKNHQKPWIVNRKYRKQAKKITNKQKALKKAQREAREAQKQAHLEKTQLSNQALQNDQVLVKSEIDES